MTRDEAPRCPETHRVASARPAAHVLTRQEAYQQILRLCEPVRWGMARRRVH